MSGFYAIPLFNVQEQWIARWNRIERPERHRPDRLSAGNLVAAAGRPTEVTPVTPDQRIADARRSVQADPGPQAGCAGAARSPQQAARHRPAAEEPDLRGGRSGDHGAGGAFHRIRTAVQFRDRGATAQYRRIRADGAGRASRRPGGGAVAAAVAAGGIDGRAQPHRRARDRDHRAGSTASFTPISP